MILLDPLRMTKELGPTRFPFRYKLLLLHYAISVDVAADALRIWWSIPSAMRASVLNVCTRIYSYRIKPVPSILHPAICPSVIAQDGRTEVRRNCRHVMPRMQRAARGGDVPRRVPITSHNAVARFRRPVHPYRIVRAPLISFPQAQGYPTDAGNHAGDLPRISRIAREHIRIRTERSERAQSRSLESKAQ